MSDLLSQRLFTQQPWTMTLHYILIMCFDMLALRDIPHQALDPLPALTTQLSQQ